MVRYIQNRVFSAVLWEQYTRLKIRFSVVNRSTRWSITLVSNFWFLLFAYWLWYQTYIYIDIRRVYVCFVWSHFLLYLSWHWYSAFWYFYLSGEIISMFIGCSIADQTYQICTTSLNIVLFTFSKCLPFCKLRK